MPTILRMRSVLTLLVTFLLVGVPAFAQTETATLSGVIQDPKGGAVPEVEVTATRIETGTVMTTKTNGAGIYFFTGLMPGHYHLMVRKPGFKEIAIKEFQLYVQDKLEQNFSLEIGSVSETVTITADDLHINTTDAAVSTVVDRQFAENLPLNGRSFQTLIQLTPGVVLTANTGNDSGQFSVNGQRASSNYWMLDGVGANIGVGVLGSTGNGISGAQGPANIFGGTNSLVSVDALQEFRIQTSTFAPEFGRTPGGQVSIVTRSGTNQWHGSAFDYFRNDVLDANDWFANSEGLSKPRERQNDFGGTFSGPIVRDHTFFFFSYEGMRLRLPQTILTLVPDLNSRQTAAAGIQPYLNSYPVPNGPVNSTTHVGQFNASFSNPGTVDAYSLRADHKMSEKLSLFARYNYSPSELSQRGAVGSALSVVEPAKITTQTGTAGLTWNVSGSAVNDLRFNYSSSDSSSSFKLDDFGGAVPITSLPFPSGFSVQNAAVVLQILSLGSSGQILFVGDNAHDVQHQVNIVDNFSLQKSSHTLKFGGDFRRLAPDYDAGQYGQTGIFLTVPQAVTGTSFRTLLASRNAGTLLFRNLGIFAQDTWRKSARLSLTYGLRWDVDFAPESLAGPNFIAVSAFDIRNLTTLAPGPSGTPPFNTRYGSVAPRIGVAYQVFATPNWETVLRGGFGAFYDLATSEAGNILPLNQFPFGTLNPIPGAAFPLTGSAGAAPPITQPAAGTWVATAFDPHLETPYTLEWNVALEQGLGKLQTISTTYVGAVGRSLLQSALIQAPNSNFARITVVTNSGTSDYHALQVQFRRQLRAGLQSVASYSWSHSIDTASAGSLGSPANRLTALDPNINRGSSDFDVRNAFSLGLTYDVPVARGSALSRAILGGWSTDNVFQARSAPPVNVFYSGFSRISGNFFTAVRPSVTSTGSFYLLGSQYPGGKALNPAPFSPPATDPVTKLPLTEGNLPRNALRGFGAYQWDLAVHRDFRVSELVKLQFRAEMFNVLNHPNFGQPSGDLGSATVLNLQFGRSTQMLGQSLSGSLGNGGFNPLYQIGGPRSIQLALKLLF